MKSLENPVLSGQIAVVTGAGRGIGAAVARTLAALGARVVVCGRRRAALESTAASIQDSGGQSSVMECDVRDLRSVESLAERVERTFGRVDILVNNAGVGGSGGPLHQLAPEVWDQVLNTNLRGAYYCIRSFTPLMIRAHAGHIINISSIAGKNALPNGAAYAASKWGLNGLSYSVAEELRAYNGQRRSRKNSRSGLLLEEIFKCLARVIRTLAALAGSFLLKHHAHGIEGTIVALVLGRDPCGNRLVAFETARRVEVLALLAGVEFETALRALGHGLGKILQQGAALRAAGDGTSPRHVKRARAEGVVVPRSRLLQLLLWFAAGVLISALAIFAVGQGASWEGSFCAFGPPCTRARWPGVNCFSHTPVLTSVMRIDQEDSHVGP